MALINISDVRYSYRAQADDRLALDGVSLSIERGTVVGLTGPSGSGKSTLGRLLASYIPNYFDGSLEGQVTVGGHDIRESSIAEVSDTVGLLFENPFDQLTGASTTVFEEVAFGLENRGVPRDELIAAVSENLERTGIDHLYDRNPQQLSGGQSQRLALASILAMDPEILVLDEPTSQLDPHGTEEVFDVVTELADQGYTVVAASHDLQRLAPHLDRLVVLEGGQVVEDGTPRSLFVDGGGRGRYELPDAAVVGKRLREAGAVPEDRPLPLTLEEASDELGRAVRSTGDGTIDAAGESEPVASNRAIADPANGGATNGDALVRFDETHFFYDDVHALRGLDLRVDTGCVCVIGQNGAGKSTFLKHLNGLLTPSDGRVVVNGKETTDHRIAQLAGEVALSFQNPNNQLFHNTIEAEVKYGPRNLGFDEDRVEELATGAMERMDLLEIRDRNPYDIGLARRKHVAVASVLAMDTPVVALDEPTGSQDARGIELLGDVVERLTDAGRLVVVITHDVSFARDHADRVVALSEGDVLLDGTPRAVFGRAQTLAETDVEPPFVTRLGAHLGLDETVLSVDELFDRLERGYRPTSTGDESDAT